MCAVAALVATIVLAMTASAQQAGDVFERALQSAMQRAAPDFRMQPPVKESGGSSGYIRWTSNGANVSVRYFVRESPESAAGLLQKRASSLSIPTKRIDGFGDEAYLLAPSNPSGERKIWFRKGAAIFEVGALGEANTRRFAALFDEAIGRSSP
jgi:hypothetical protein